MKKRELLCTVGGNELVQPLQKTIWSFPKKLKIGLPYDPAISLLDIFLKKAKTLKRCINAYVHCSIIYNRQGIEATKVFIKK